MDVVDSQAMAINAEISEFLLARIRHDPGRVWDSLSEEQRTKEVVLAILDCDPHFFGECPWVKGVDRLEGYSPGRATLPDEFCEDRDVALAYASGEDYEQSFNGCENYWYELPEFIQDDEEVVIAVCSKHFESLRDASPRLRDNKAVVLSAVDSRGWNSCDALEYASDRLRGDMDILLATVKNTEYTFDWLGSFARFSNAEGEKASL